MKQAELSQRRKAQMAASLKKLMARKSLQKITIQEIADDCGINRYTFYYHFQDIYELLAWTFQQEALSLIRQSDSCLTWEDGLYLFLRSIRENAAVCRCALNSLAQESLRSMFHQEVSFLMRTFLTEEKGVRQVSEEYFSFLTDFYISALCGILMEWIRRDMDTPEETLLRYLRVTLEGCFQAAFLSVWTGASPPPAGGILFLSRSVIPAEGKLAHQVLQKLGLAGELLAGRRAFLRRGGVGLDHAGDLVDAR